MDINNLIDRGGLKYAPNDDEPYKGKVFDFHENGQKKLDGNYRKGLMNGKWTYYFGNGNIYGIGNFINGDGGNVSEVSNIPRNGRNRLWIFYYENGQKINEGTYNDGKKDGKGTQWYENGQKEIEVIYKDGEPDGLRTLWYEHGQKQYEGTYKDGELISAECWDEDGNEKECD